MTKFTLKVFLLSLALIGSEAFAQNNETSLLGEAISNEFKGITSSLLPIESTSSQSTTTNRQTVPATPPAF